jgi:2-methylisocitrate lyase-like PEP mutase family enzyme
MLGINALTSLMTFALFAASIFSSLTVKMVFSLGFSSAASSAAGVAAAAGAADAAGMAISVMLRRVCDVSSAQQDRYNSRHNTS